MATITAPQRKSFSRAYAGIAVAVVLAGAVGAAAGWAIGHHQRDAVHTDVAAVAAPAVTHSENPFVADTPPVDLPVTVSDTADAAAPAKGGMAEQIDAQAAAAVSTPAQPEAVYIYLVGSQDEADARTAYLGDQYAESGGRVSFAGRPTDTPEAQAEAYAEIEMLSGQPGVELHVVDLRPSTTDVPATDPGFTSPAWIY